MTNNRLYFILIAIFLISVCSSCKKQHSHVSTDTISPSLHIETYQIYSGGVFDGDAFEIYLTDSTKFRVYLGDYDEHKWPQIIVQGDAVKINWQDVQPFRHRKFRCNINSLKSAGVDDLTHSEYHPN